MTHLNDYFESTKLGQKRIAAQLLGFRAGVYALAILCIVGAWLAGSYFGIPLEVFVRDAAFIDANVGYGGFISQLGLMLWAIASTATLLTAYRNRTLAAGAGASRSIAYELRQESSLLAGFGILSLLLLADDAFMIHEPLTRGVFKPVGYGLLGSYGVYICAHSLRFRERLMVGWPWLLAPVAFLAASLGVDIIHDFHVLGSANTSEMAFIEDALKFVGIAGWSSYFVDRSIRELCAIRTLGVPVTEL